MSFKRCKTHSCFRREEANESNLASPFFDNDRLLEETLHVRLVGHVNVGADDGEGDVLQERHEAVHSIIKFVVTG